MTSFGSMGNQLPKSKSHILPSIRATKKLAVEMDLNGQVQFGSLIIPSSYFIRCHSNWAKCRSRLTLKKTNPLASSDGIRFLKETSFTSITNRICSAACFGVLPKLTLPVITATSASMSIPPYDATMSSRGPIKPSEPP